MKLFQKLVCMALTATATASLSICAFAADYTFDTAADTDYYPSTSYEDTYGTAYHYGSKNLVDYQIPELPYGVLSTTQTGVMEKLRLPGLQQTVGGSASGVYGVDSGVGIPAVTPVISSYQEPAYTSAKDMERKDGSIGTLKIPSLDINMKVWEGETKESMKKGLGHYSSTSAWDGNIGVCGHSAVMAGSQMRYDFTVANTSNVPLESFFWHDRIPTDIANATLLSTGTYSARLTYRILYKTNYSASYQVLASNLLSSNNYSFALNAIPMQAGEVVTDIYFDFGTVPVGFQSVANPTLSVMVKGMAVNGYQMVNRADAGGKYQGTWQTATANWITIVRKIGTTPKLPKTGY